MTLSRLRERVPEGRERVLVSALCFSVTELGRMAQEERLLPQPLSHKW